MKPATNCRGYIGSDRPPCGGCDECLRLQGWALCSEHGKAECEACLVSGCECGECYRDGDGLRHCDGCDEARPSCRLMHVGPESAGTEGDVCEHGFGCNP